MEATLQYLCCLKCAYIIPALGAYKLNNLKSIFSQNIYISGSPSRISPRLVWLEAKKPKPFAKQIWKKQPCSLTSTAVAAPSA